MGIFSRIVGTEKAPAAAMTAGRRQDRTADELIGVCRGILADGHVSQAEAQFLADWLGRNRSLGNIYPFNVLIRRLDEALRDGVLDDDEEADLLHALVSLVGGEAAGEHGSESASLSTSLPLDSPAPAPINHASTFVVTGTFAYGPRSRVAATIRENGGLLNTSISRKVAYVVVGEVGSRDWIHSSYGRKIERAVELRMTGTPIAILAEHHWVASLNSRA